jgi:DNA-binding NtrC family response regulator
MADARAMRVVAVDDDPQNLEIIAGALDQLAVDLTTVSDPKTALEVFVRIRPEVVLIDLMMPNIGGIELLERMIEIDPGANVILMTAHYSSDSAVEAIRKGACDYFNKPLDLPRLRRRIAEMLEEAQKRQRAARLDHELLETFQFEGMTSRSPIMLEVFAKIRRVAPHFRTVLVTGPTGSGKELIAKALHNLSNVASKPFVVANCSAIAPTLMESELFGYVRGAFTGANQDKIGLIEYAHGGILFLDEIGELPLTAQATLLRAVQNQEVQRVGSPAVRKVDVRIVAATNRNLRTLASENKFRDDLYYRLSMVELRLPGLADRKEDIPLLQRLFLEKFSSQYGKEIRGLTRRSQVLLASHSWPGNVRELENVLGSACMMAESQVIDVPDLPDQLRERKALLSEDGRPMLSLQEMEKRYVADVVERVQGNKARAAEILGISRNTLYRMIDDRSDETPPAGSATP